jgi:hypothetical protein
MGLIKMQRKYVANKRFSNESPRIISAISRVTLSEISMALFVEKTKKGGPANSESPVRRFSCEKVDFSYRESIRKRSASPVGSR